MPHTAASAPLKPLLFALHDSVMALAPRGWTEVELKLVPHGRMLRLTDVETKGHGLEPKPMPDLGVDGQAEAFRLSEGLTELAELLKARAKPWTPGCVRVKREGGFADWQLLQADGSVAWFARLEAADLAHLLVSDELLDAVAGTEKAFAALQARLEPHVSNVTGFAYDSATGLLRIEREGGSVREVPALFVGRYGEEDFTWAWGWSGAEVPPPSTAAVHRVCAPGARTPGLTALWRPFFQCDEGFAWALATHVAVAVGARGLFRAEVPDKDEVLVFAPMELP